MDAIILQRRGNKADINVNNLTQGELAILQDTDELAFKNNAGNLVTISPSVPVDDTYTKEETITKINDSSRYINVLDIGERDSTPTQYITTPLSNLEYKKLIISAFFMTYQNGSPQECTVGFYDSSNSTWQTKYIDLGSNYLETYFSIIIEKSGTNLWRIDIIDNDSNQLIASKTVMITFNSVFQVRFGVGANNGFNYFESLLADGLFYLDTD